MIAKIRFIDEETGVTVSEVTYKPTKAIHDCLMHGDIYGFDIHHRVFLSDEYKECMKYEKEEKSKI